MVASRGLRQAAGLLAVLALVGILGAPATLAQPIGDDAFPLVTGGPPPDWVQPGLRLTWYGEAASIRTSYTTYVEDENGDWEDPVTHKRYRQVPETEMPEAAARAFTQSDVIALDGNDVVMTSTMYGIDIETGQLNLVPLWGDRYAGASVSGAWIRPDLLADIQAGVQTTGARQMRILRGNYQLGDQAVPSVAFMDKGEGSYASTVFDAASGVLIASTGRAKGPGSPVHGPLDDPEGNVSIAWTRLAGVRQRDFPGIGEALPDWVRDGTVLRYTGTLTVTNPFDPDGFQVSYPIEATVTVDETGPGWATYASTTTVTMNGYPETSGATGATGAAGQYWYTPDALAQLDAGMVLDEDPLTGVRMTVERASADGTAIRSEAPGFAITLTFDAANGAMTAMHFEQSAYSTIDLTLAGVE